MSEFLEDNNYLPIELILDIFYKKGGLLHPTSNILKIQIAYILDNNKCFVCSSKKDYVSLVKIRKSYISHHKLSILKKIILEEKSHISVCWNCAH
jgi:hypothetical protein